MTKKLSFSILSIYFILFFVLFYFEPISIGGIKFALLWKLPFVIFLLFYFVLGMKKKAVLPLFVFFGLLLSFKFFISLSSLQYLSVTITEFIKFSIFFFIFFYLRNKYKRETLLSMGKYLSIFIIVSFIPFMLGLLKSLGKTIDMSKFGDMTGGSLTGIFQNPHAAGITLSFAMLVLYFNLLNETNSKAKLFLLGVLVLGVIELSMTMVRTSLVMFFIGVFFLSYKHFKIKHYVLMILSILIVFGYLSSIYEKSVVLQSMVTRLQGDTKYTDFDEVGSGRVMFGRIAIESWQSEGLLGVIMGLGMELGRDKMGKAMGTRLVAHNGFIQILQSEGIIGFSLLLLYLFFLFLFILKYKNNNVYLLTMSLFLAYIISYYFQGGNYFLVYVLFAIYLGILSKNDSLLSSDKVKYGHLYKPNPTPINGKI